MVFYDERYQTTGIRTPVAGVLWTEDYDGQSIIALMQEKPKMTVRELIIEIQAEGGSVDENMIIHRK